MTSGSALASAVNIANAATFNNAGTTNGVVTNACNGTVNNSGSMANSVNNSGALNNTGSISGALTNNNNCGTVTNNGSITANVINNGSFNNSSGHAVGGTFQNGATGTLENRGTLIGAVTNNGAATNYGTLSSTLSNTGTFDNKGLISQAITNSGTFTNSGTASNSITNSGIATNTIGGVIGGSVNNSASTSQFTNNGRIDGGVTNAQSAQFTNAGSIGGNATNNGVFTNASGAGVIGTFLNDTTGTLTNAGTLGGAVTNNGIAKNTGTLSSTLANSGIFDNAGQINGIVTNTGLFGNAGTLLSSLTNSATGFNYAGGVINGSVTNDNASSKFTNSGRIEGAVNNNVAGAQFDNSGRINGATTNVGTFNNTGTVNNTLANSGTLNLNGTSGRVTGAITGAGTTNVNGSFVQEAAITNATVNVNNGGTLYATTTITAASGLNIANGGLLATVGSPTVVGNVVNNGAVFPLDSSYNLNVTGNYTQTATGGFITAIASPTEYSRLIATGQVSAANGSTVLAVLDPAMRIGPGTVFAGVLTAGTGGGTKGNVNVATVSDRYTLTGTWNGNNYDLGYGSTYTGALARYTLASISAVQGPTLNALHQRYAVLNAVMEYDCNRFDKYNVCISAQARSTGFGTQATGAGVFNIAYRPTEQTRIGAYIDYQVAAGNPTTNGTSAAGAVTTGSVNYGYDNATFGGYLGFSQSGYSGRIINTGVQAFVSGGYNPGKIQTTRALIMDPNHFDFVDSQPGSGSASLNAYYVRGMAGYGYALTEQATLMPYLGVRYTDVTRGGYMEGYNAVVTQPLVYNAYYERLVTGFGGMMLNGQMTSKFGVLVGLGTELDFSRSASNFAGYSPIPITILNTNSSMTAFGFQHGGSWNGFRPTGNLGAYYDVMPNHRVSINGYAGQQAWSSRTYTTGLLGYQVAF